MSEYSQPVLAILDRLEATDQPHAVAMVETIEDHTTNDAQAVAMAELFASSAALLLAELKAATRAH